MVAGRKVPRDVYGNLSGSTHAEDYVDFQAAEAAFQAKPVMGTAFCFTANDPYGGVDLDNCLEDMHTPKEWVLPILDRFRGHYMEVSPSLKGLKIYGEFRKPDRSACVVQLGDGAVEIYDRGRFFTFTEIRPSWLLCYSGDDVSDMQSAVEWLIERYFPKLHSVQDAIRHLDSLGVGLRARAAAYTAAVDRPAPGSRNVTAFKLAGNLMALDDAGQRLADDEVYEFLCQWNQSLPEPLPDDELRQCIRSAHRKAPERPAKPAGVLEAPAVDLSVFGAKAAAQDVTEDAPAEPAAPKLYTVFTDVYSEWQADWQRAEPPVLWRTGMPWEIGPGGLTVIGGGPGTGKTTLVMQAVIEALINHDDLRALVLSVEVPGKEMVSRALAVQAAVNYHAMRYRVGLTTAQESAVVHHGEVFRRRIAPRLAILDRPHSMKKLCAAVQDFQANLVVLDYIQRIPPVDHHRLDLRAACNATLDAARQLCDAGCGVFAVSSLSRPSRREDGYQKVSITAFRESGELEYGADEAYIMCRDEDDQRLVTMHHLKARYRDKQDFQCVQDDTLRFTHIQTNGLVPHSGRMQEIEIP